MDGDLSVGRKGEQKLFFSVGRVQRREDALSGFLFWMARAHSTDHMTIQKANPVLKNHVICTDVVHVT